MRAIRSIQNQNCFYSVFVVFSADDLREAKAVNKSLKALGDVIEALSKEKKHIPFRDHVLTDVLSDCLVGTSTSSLLSLIVTSLLSLSFHFSSPIILLLLFSHCHFTSLLSLPFYFSSLIALSILFSHCPFNSLLSFPFHFSSLLTCRWELRRL